MGAQWTKVICPMGERCVARLGMLKEAFGFSVANVHSGVSFDVEGQTPVPESLTGESAGHLSSIGTRIGPVQGDDAGGDLVERIPPPLCGSPGPCSVVGGESEALYGVVDCEGAGVGDRYRVGEEVAQAAENTV